MFGDISGMMQKLKDAKANVAKTKAALAQEVIESSSANGAVKISLTANHKIKLIKVADALLQDKEALEDYLIIALNNGLKRATDIAETKLSEVAKTGLPNIPGLDLF